MLAPQYTYVTGSSDSAYLKVPPNWREVNESTLQTAEGSANADGTYLWSRAYEASAKPSVGRVYGDPGLLPQLREYHREATVAHREHGKISRGLPGVPEPALAVSGSQWLVTPHPDPLGVNDHPDGDGSSLETEPGSGPAPSHRVLT